MPIESFIPKRIHPLSTGHNFSAAGDSTSSAFRSSLSDLSTLWNQHQVLPRLEDRAIQDPRSVFVEFVANASRERAGIESIKKIPSEWNFPLYERVVNIKLLDKVKTNMRLSCS
jgi:hypothetical protein